MPIIDTRPFLADDNVLTVCKSIDGKGSQWIIMDTDGDSVEIEFGRIVLVWLNLINPIKPDYFNVIEKLISEQNDTSPNNTTNRKSELWQQHYDSMVNFILNKKTKSQDELFDFYKKYRYFAYHYFSNIPFMEYADVPQEIRKPSEIVGYTVVNGQPYQILRVFGYTSLFALDLWELLFNSKTKYNIKRCKQCKCFFRTSKKNRDFCIECQPKNEKEYAEEYRNAPINKLRKSILFKLDSNKRFKEAPELQTKLRNSFLTQFDYYYSVIVDGKMNLEMPEECDINIKTMEDFLKWLADFEMDVRVYHKGGT